MYGVQNKYRCTLYAVQYTMYAGELTLTLDWSLAPRQTSAAISRYTASMASYADDLLTRASELPLLYVPNLGMRLS